MRFPGLILRVAALAFTLTAFARAQEPAKQEPAKQAEKASSDFITPHISDAHHIEIPSFSLKGNLTREIELPRWAPVHIGPLAVDLSPTKHVVMMLLAATFCVVLLLAAAMGQARAAAAGSMFVFQGPHRAVLISYPPYAELVRLLGA